MLPLLIRLSLWFCSLIAGLIAALLFSYGLLENIFVPDPCYYHARDTPRLFDLFYKIGSSDGYHPSPTTLHHILTLAVGLSAATALARWMRKIY